MASLTPGVLSKLIQNIDNATVKVAGEHRSALLQVIGIVPFLGGENEDDLWKSRGFFLRVSDSVHSAYVSVSEEDTDLILSDKIQLGQFIHVTRLDTGSPVPVLRGVKPVPKRRPCVGDPKDLISSDSLLLGAKKNGKKESKPKVVKVKKNVSDESKTRRVSLGNAKIENLELRRLSLDSSRKAWDRSPGTKNVSNSKSLDSASVRSAKKDSSEKDLTLKHPSSSISPLKTKNVIVPPKLISKPISKDLKSSVDGNIPSHLVKVPLSFKTWSDSKISWDSLPTTMHDIGKEVMYCRNAGFMSAVQALQETFATDGVLRCMSMFAELCESSQKDSAVPLVEQFLNLHQGMQKAAAVVNDLLTPPPEANSSKMRRNSMKKIAASWVQAAVETNLSKFSLFTKEKGNALNGEKSLCVVIENTQKKTEGENNSPENKRSPKNNGPHVSNSSARRYPATKKTYIERKEWSAGKGLKEAASLAEKLLIVSRTWFLNYLESSLKNGFGLRSGEVGGSEIAALLGELKRVNQWLDDSVIDGSGVGERVEGLKKNLYGFLLDHVDSAVGQTGS